MPITTRSTCRPSLPRPRWSSSNPECLHGRLPPGCRKSYRPTALRADGRGLVPTFPYTYSVQRCVLTFPYFKQHILFALSDEADYLYRARAMGRTCSFFFAIRCQVDNGVNP